MVSLLRRRSIRSLIASIIHGEGTSRLAKKYGASVRRVTTILFLGLGTMSTGVLNLHHVVFASPSKSRIRVLQALRTEKDQDEGQGEVV